MHFREVHTTLHKTNWGASTSDAKPDWWCYPRRKCRGEVSGNMHTLAHAQLGSWAYHYFRRCLTSQNEVKGDVHISVPAPIGSRRDAHLSAHAKYWSWRDADEWRCEQLERWGQCKLRYPPNAKLNHERPSQGGVVEPNEQMWLGRGIGHLQWTHLRCHRALLLKPMSFVLKLHAWSIACDCCQ